MYSIGTINIETQEVMALARGKALAPFFNQTETIGKIRIQILLDNLFGIVQAVMQSCY